MTGADGLRDQLAAARQLGFLGPGPVEAHIRHAEGFGLVIERELGRAPGELADLGSGAGVPGLALATRWPQAVVALIESSVRRAGFLRAAVGALGLAQRVEVIEQRAESVAQDSLRRESFEVVSARGFGSPAVSAEIGAALVRLGGLVVVSEPPEEDPSRWPAGPLAMLGLGPAHRQEAEGVHFVVIVKEELTDRRYPRPVGRAAKRPLW